MLGSFSRIVIGLLAAWFTFLFAAMALAFLKRRDAVPQEPDADEIDLVASFGPLDFRSTATAFRGGRVDTWFGGGGLARLSPRLRQSNNHSATSPALSKPSLSTARRRPRG